MIETSYDTAAAGYHQQLKDNLRENPYGFVEVATLTHAALEYEKQPQAYLLARVSP
jgi:hypothetical protein